MRCRIRLPDKIWLSGCQRIYPARQLAFNVSGFIPVDDPSLGQLVNHGNNSWQRLGSGFVFFNSLQVADSITGGFAIVPVSVSALGCLTNIFLSSLVICHFAQKF